MWSHHSFTRSVIVTFNAFTTSSFTSNQGPVNMTTFSKANFAADIYNKVRPTYNKQFYQILKDYTFKSGSEPPIQRAIDLGCGTGAATYPLLDFSEQVVGVDLSAKMVDVAISNAKEKLPEAFGSEALQFKVGTVESFVKSHEIERGSCDLITAAQCIHWFQEYPSFFKNVQKLLKPGGVMAYFYYLDPVIVDYAGSTDAERTSVIQKVNTMYQDLSYNDADKLGPFWEPGRHILRNFCNEVDKSIPRDLFEDIEIVKYDPDLSSVSLPSDKDLNIQQPNATLKAIYNYLLTYSSYHNYCEKHGKDNDLIENFISSLESEFGWDRETTKIHLVWKTGYTFIRKK